MKNAFYFILKALFVLKVLNFLSWHILPNISQSKNNQTMIIGQVIEHNKRNIFLKNMQKMRKGD